MISAAAESVPTLKLANLKQLAESGAPDAQETPALPAATISARPPTDAREGSGSFSASGSRRSAAPVPEAAAPPAPAELQALEPTVAIASTTGAGRPAPTQPVRPISAKGVAATGRQRSKAGLWIGLAAVIALAVAGYFVLRPSAAPPAAPATAPVDAGPPPEAIALVKSLEEGKRLLQEGRFEESAVQFRTVLGQDPQNAEATRLLADAENAIKN